jgi:hypothetical protein
MICSVEEFTFTLSVKNNRNMLSIFRTATDRQTDRQTDMTHDESRMMAQVYFKILCLQSSGTTEKNRETRVKKCYFVL